MRVTSRIASAIRRIGGRSYYADPQAYWDRRHRVHGSELEGSGRLHLPADENARNYEHKWEHVCAAVIAVAPSGTLLDVGCGTGLLTRRFADLGMVTSGVDFSPTAIEVARAAVPDAAELRVGDLTSFEMGTTFDVVVCIDVLFHLVDDEAWRRALVRMAAHAAGGWLVIQEHLVDEEGVEPEAEHTRWRRLCDYTAALGPHRLHHHERYSLEVERTTKDVLTFCFVD